MCREVGQASGSTWGSSSPAKHCVHASRRFCLLPPCSKKQVERSASQVILRLLSRSSVWQDREKGGEGGEGGDGGEGREGGEGRDGRVEREGREEREEEGRKITVLPILQPTCIYMKHV